jgi:AcrR family transcriptional regulator
LSRPRIYATALQLIAEDGFDQFSMRKLAQRLGVEAMALYKHVANKAALLDGVVVLLLERIVVPGEGPWPARLRAMAHSYRRLALANPNVFPILITRPLPAEATPVLDHIWTVLADAGLTEDQRLVALRSLSSYLLGFTLSEIVDRVSQGEGAIITPAWQPSQQENDVLFEQGLDVILTGLQAPRPTAPDRGESRPGTRPGALHASGK